MSSGRRDYPLAIVMRTARLQLVERTERYILFRNFASLALTAKSSRRTQLFRSFSVGSYVYLSCSIELLIISIHCELREISKFRVVFDLYLDSNTPVFALNSDVSSLADME